MDTVYRKAAAKAKCSPSSSAENSLVNVSQAIPASSSGIVSIPQPSEALLGNSPPPFLSKTYDMVDDPNTDDIVSWSSANNSFIVWNPPELGENILPNYFKHNNFSSFVRQLNTYGFRKVDPDRWEFAAEGFLRRQKHLLNKMYRRRRRPISQNQIQAEEFGGLEEELEQLKRDKNALMHELIEMRQQQQSSHQTLRFLGHRLAATEQRQQQMMAFLAKTMQNPFIFANLVHQNDSNKRIDPAKASLTDFNNPQSTSVDTTCNLLKELFHGIEQESRGRSDDSSTSDSHLNVNPNEDGEGFTLVQSSTNGSHVVALPPILDDTSEGDWTEIFESVEAYNRSKMDLHSSFAEQERLAACIANIECSEERPTQQMKASDSDSVFIQHKTDRSSGEFLVQSIIHMLGKHSCD